MFNFKNGVEVAEINFPHVVMVCSQISLIVEKKILYVNLTIFTYILIAPIIQ